MSAFEELEEAPILSIARRECSLWWAVKTDSASWAIFNARGEYVRHESTEDLAEEGRHKVLAQPVAPTSAREALALAWELAHPVREGQVIPEGTEVLAQTHQMLWVYGRADRKQVATANDEANVRTLDPLPDPEPDWLDAPAVLAATILESRSERRTVFVRGDKTGTQWLRDTKVYRRDELIDVVPLYPKGQNA